MADFHVRSDSVDVEQIMGQIRARIREKRGADYTEAELQHLASVKLERFLDSRGVRSTLVEAFKSTRVPSAEPPTYEFTDETLFESPRPWLRKVRRLLAPILRLFINPDRVAAAFRVQKEVNADFHRRFRAREEMDPLYYEVVHNLVLEITRLGIDVQNLKMRVESLGSRVDFDERRARSLEGMVQRRPERGFDHGRGQEGGRRPDQGRQDQGRHDQGRQDQGRQDQGRQDQGRQEPGRSESGRPDQGRAEPGRSEPLAASGDGPTAGPTGGAGAETRPTEPRQGDMRPDQRAGEGRPGEMRSDDQRDRRRRRRRRRRRPGQTMGNAGQPGGGAPPQGSGGGYAPPETAGGWAAETDQGGEDDGPDDEGGSEDSHQ